VPRLSTSVGGGQSVPQCGTWGTRHAGHDDNADGADISGGVSSRSMFVESNQVGLAKDVSKPGG